MSELDLTWVKCKNNGNDVKYWCNLVKLDKKDLNYNGVYVIWYPNGPIFKVGSGNIKNRLTKHANLNEDFMTKFNKYNKDNNTGYDYKSLLVAFAKVNGNQMEGVEKYLDNNLKIVKETSERFPDVKEIKVNLRDWQ